MVPPAVELRNLVKEFVERDRRTRVRAVDDVSLQVQEGEFFALLGPSGCGKTTTLRAIAGFEDPTSGTLLLRGASMRGVPPFHRPVNTVFQDYALFPHMTVMQNVLFGMRMVGVAPREAKARALEALDMVRLPQVANRRPQELSGGQKQRVALARALVNRPAVLLLDEPLGALDLKLRRAMQLELKQLQQHLGITFIYVTHDQEEALTMADRIAVMHEGKVLQVGGPDDVYERPASRFVADFIGETNFLAGQIVAKGGGRGTLRLTDGRVLEAVVRDDDLRPGATAWLAIRPEKITVEPVADDDDSVAGPTTLLGTIAESHYLGTDTRYGVRVSDDVMLVVRIQNQTSGFDAVLPTGSRVRLGWHGDHASILGDG